MHFVHCIHKLQTLRALLHQMDAPDHQAVQLHFLELAEQDNELAVALLQVWCIQIGTTSALARTALSVISSALLPVHPYKADGQFIDHLALFQN
jgi:hypothetical protein